MKRQITGNTQTDENLKYFFLFFFFKHSLYLHTQPISAVRKHYRYNIYIMRKIS